MKRPAEFGTMYKAKRFDSPRQKSPGVGDYDLTKFKSFAKASETGFEIPESVKLLSKFAKKNVKRAFSAQRPARPGPSVQPAKRNYEPVNAN